MKPDSVMQMQTAAPGSPLSVCRVLSYQELGSTNAELLERADMGEPEGTVVTADAQTAGRGRRGRNWYSPPGQDIYLSILLRPQIPAEKASGLTLAAAAAVREAILMNVDRTDPKDDPEKRYRIKWPNDIVADGKKVCGILTETRMEDMQIRAVVVGIGINVNAPSFPEEIRDIAASLRSVEGKLFDRQQLIRDLLQCFAGKYALFLQSGDLSGFADEYRSGMAGIGQQVRISGPAWEKCGILRGIDASGGLLLQTEDGRIENVISGEVSLRGMDAYI